MNATAAAFARTRAGDLIRATRPHSGECGEYGYGEREWGDPYRFRTSRMYFIKSSNS